MPKEPKTDQLAGSKENTKDKTAPAKSKEKKKNKKKAFQGSKEAIKIGVQKEEENKASLTSKQGKQAAPDLSNPEAKGRGLVNGDRTETESRSRSTTTSRGECSGQKKPDS